MSAAPHHEGGLYGDQGPLLVTEIADGAGYDSAHAPARLQPPSSAAGDLPEALKELSARQKVRGRLRLAAAVGDVLAICLAFAIAGILRFRDPVHEQVWTMLGVIVPVYLVVALNQRAFHIGELLEVRRGLRNALAGFIIALCVVGLVVFFLKVSEDFSRAVFGTGALFSLMLIPAIRYCHTLLSQGLFGPTAFNEVVIEDGVSIATAPGVVLLNAQRDSLSPALDDPVMLDRLGQCLRCADRVIVACRPERRRLWSMALRGVDVEAEVLAPELDELGALGVAKHNGRSTLLVGSAPLGVLDCFMKRALDLILVGLALPFCLPILALVAIAIKIDSPGPVLFRQQRVGLGNRLFTLYKFRSMRCDQLDGAGTRSARRDDDRTTRVGRFIRRTSLDELPQIFNVLSGEMSIVGPRPHALGSRAEDRLFWDIDLAYWHRHAVKPGMTGLAQIRGYRGATERMDDLRNRLQADLEYLNGWTIWRDLNIIFATFRVLVHRNAF